MRAGSGSGHVPQTYSMFCKPECPVSCALGEVGPLHVDLLSGWSHQRAAQRISAAAIDHLPRNFILFSLFCCGDSQPTLAATSDCHRKQDTNFFPGQCRWHFSSFHQRSLPGCGWAAHLQSAESSQTACETEITQSQRGLNWAPSHQWPPRFPQKPRIISQELFFSTSRHFLAQANHVDRKLRYLWEFFFFRT